MKEHGVAIPGWILLRDIVAFGLAEGHAQCPSGKTWYCGGVMPPHSRCLSRSA